MKKKDITFQEKLNALRLDISHPNSRGQALVLVEGDSDIRLFRKFFLLDNCKVEHLPGGKVKLKEGLSTLLEMYPLIIGIQDADFDHLQDSKTAIPNIFLTDYHDIEMTMLAQEVILNALLFEYTKDLPANKHLAFRKEVLQSIETISYLKWLNHKENLGLSFEVGFQNLISIKEQAVDFPEYIARVLSKSNAKVKSSDSEILQKVKALMEQPTDLLQLTNGHDLLKAFAKYFREQYGRKSVNDEILASSIRMSFTFEQYRVTALYQLTEKWAKENEVEMYVTV